MNIREEDQNFKQVIRYQCKWCHRDGFKTNYKHKCRFNPDMRNCFSCRHNKGIRFYNRADGTYVSEEEAENLQDPIKIFVCEDGYDQKGRIRTIGNCIKADCPEYEMMPDYKGRETYSEFIRDAKTESASLSGMQVGIFTDPDDELPFF